MKPSSPIDVVVATRNRPDDLSKFIPTLLAQQHGDFRLLLIDQSDDPGPNHDSVSSFRDDRIVHVVQREKGKSKALNLALGRVTAPLLAFTDDDCTLPEDWLSRALDCFSAHPRAGIAFGSVLPAPHDPESVYIPSLEFDCFRSLRRFNPRSDGILIGMGANMFIRREALQRIGSFDEDLGPGGPLFTGEECELTYRAIKHGLEVLCDPSLKVVHWGARPISGDVARQLVNTGFFAIGAGYGKHIRSGDLGAAAIVVQESAHVASLIANAVVKRQRPLHVRRLAMLWKGAVLGFWSGPAVRRIP